MKTIITDERIFEIVRSVCGDVELDDDLFELGVMDSYAIITITGELENEGILIEPTVSGIDGFSSVRRIISEARKSND